MPAASTISAALARHGQPGLPRVRFEHPRPDALWRMAFKGDFTLASARTNGLPVGWETPEEALHDVRDAIKAWIALAHGPGHAVPGASRSRERAVD